MITIKHNISLEDFEAWSGGEETLEKVIEAGKIDLLEQILLEEYPNGIDEIELNDLLRHEDKWIFNVCEIS